MEREFVTGIGGSANRAKRGEINVEGGEMFEGELGFFCWDRAHQSSQEVVVGQWRGWRDRQGQ